MIPFLLLAAFVQAAHASVCNQLFNVPAPYAAQFSRYVTSEYVVPLRHVHYVEIGLYRDLHVYDQSLGDMAEDDPQMLSAHARVRLDNSATPRAMTFEALTLSDQLDPGFTYRTVLAHLLTKVPGVREIEFDLYGLPDYGPTRGRLMRGADPASALAASDAAEALRDFGFKKLDPLVSFVEEQDSRELILRMRATKP